MSLHGLPSGPENPGAVLFTPEKNGNLDGQQFNTVFANSGAGWWAEQRASRFGEYVEPRLLYVVPDTMHVVSWVNHKGISEVDSDELTNYSAHHVVCDCAAESVLEGHPASALGCEDVQAVLEQRAVEIGAQHRVPETLIALTEFDDEALDFRLTYLGQEFAIRAIANLIGIDKTHPEMWVANRISGLHEIDLLAKFVDRGTQEVMPLLELMEQGNIIDIVSDKVKLAA